MKHLRLYLSTLFLRRFAAVGLGVMILVSLLDSLGSGDLLPEDAGLAGQLRFTLLRLPMIFDSTFAIIIFLSILATYLSLIRRNEIVALLAMGVSVFGQFRALAPCLCLVGVAGAIIITLTSPPAARSLTDWLGPQALMAEQAEDSHIWVSEPDALVRINEISSDTLADITIFHRSGEGQITSVTQAAHASYDRDGWKLDSARTLVPAGEEDAAPELWETPQTQESLFKLQTYPRFLSFQDLWQLYELRGSGSRPSSAYLVWALDRLFMPVLCIGFLLLGIPMMQRAGRRDTGEIAAVFALGLGFAYLIGDGILITLAESGVVSGWTGAFGPLLALLLAGLWLALGSERAK